MFNFSQQQEASLPLTPPTSDIPGPESATVYQDTEPAPPPTYAQEPMDQSSTPSLVHTEERNEVQVQALLATPTAQTMQPLLATPQAEVHAELVSSVEGSAAVHLRTPGTPWSPPIPAHLFARSTDAEVSHVACAYCTVFVWK